MISKKLLLAVTSLVMSTALLNPAQAVDGPKQSASVSSENTTSPENIPHITDSIHHLAEIRGELVKEMSESKKVEDTLESAKLIMDIDHAIITLHAVERMHSNVKKLN